MNVFFKNTVTGLKSSPIGGDETGTVYLTESTAYCIDCEGTLYSSARYKDGSFDTDWVLVDFEEVIACHGTVWGMLLTAVQDCLVVDAMHDPASGYYKSAAGLAVA